MSQLNGFLNKYEAAKTIAEREEIESKVFQVARVLEASGIVDGAKFPQCARYDVSLSEWEGEIARLCAAIDAAIPINPELPEGFDSTPNNERPDSHRSWWYRPYIVTDRWEPESFEQYRDRLAGYGYEPDMTAEQWSESQEQRRAAWFAEFPEGTRYMVRCLNGGAWDRSTAYGVFGSLEAAIEAAGGVGAVPELDDEDEPSPGPC